MSSEDIQTLKFPYGIRRRPGAYIGSVEDASNIFREIIDNCIDECYRCKTMHNIDIKRVEDVYTISDDGRGIPIKRSNMDPNETMTYESLTNLNSGSKFEVNSEVSIGLNGLGTKAANALSEYYIIRSKMSLHDVNELPERLKSIYKGEKYYYLKFVRGIKSDEGFDNYKSDFSTIVEFKPDAEIFESTDANLPSELPYVQYIIEHKYNKKLNIRINGKLYDDKLKPYNTEFTLSDGKYTMLCGVEMLSKYDPCVIEGSVNGLVCNKGWHIRNFNKALVKAINILWNTDYSADDIMYGLRVRNIFLFGGNLNYTAQIKDTLASVEGYPSKGEQVADQLMPEILKYLKKDRRYWEGHRKRIESLLDAKKKIDRENLIKDTFFKKKVIPNKLVDCSSPNRMDCELLVCEGSSASSSLVQARNPKIHAVLPLRGKMLNTVGMPIEDVLKNQECENFIRAIGCGTKDHFVKNKLRYGKIIIAADNDEDGCFLGTERVRLLDDTCPTFEELVKMEEENPGREYIVYAADNEYLGLISPAKAYYPRITRYVDKLCKVTLDNGKVITCTIDHKFMLTDGTYVEAKDLKISDDLKSIPQMHIKNKSIISCPTKVPVYCMTVPIYENFMLDTSNSDISGVIVHNCHIVNLVLGLIFDHCPELINMGVVYILKGPLFKVGDEYIYQSVLRGVNTKGKTVERFKGLGSMSKDDMARVAFSKDRRLIQITMNNNDSLYATQLMTSSSKKGELLIKEGIIDVT